MEDLGSGALINMTKYGLPHEPLVGERIDSGVNIVTFSGDKLLGGPQAGIIVGKAEWIEKMRKNPMMRALRVDKLTIAALSATLQRYLTDGNTIAERFPMLNRYTRSIETLHAVAKQLTAQLQDIFGEKIDVHISETYGQIGVVHYLLRRCRASHSSLNPQKYRLKRSLQQFRNATIPDYRQNQGWNFCGWISAPVYEREQTWIVESRYTRSAETVMKTAGILLIWHYQR